MTLGTVVTTVEHDAEAIGTTVKNVLTADTLPAMSKGEAAVVSFLLTKRDPFSMAIPIPKKLVKYATVGLLFVGLVATQGYVFIDHKKAIELNSGRVGTIEAYQKQTDTSFVNVNEAIIATNKQIASLATDQKGTDAKVTAMAAQVSQLNAKLSPVYPLKTRKTRTRN